MDPISPRVTGLDSRVAALDARVTLSAGARMLAGQVQSAAPGSFANAIGQALKSVNAGQVQATGLAQEFQLGNPRVTLEDTVISAQKASLSLQAAVQFRNRVVQAYQEIMSMNV